jgi:hypothetical protein
MSAAVLVVTPSPVRAAWAALCQALWLRFASLVLAVRAGIETSPASLRASFAGDDEAVPPTLRSPGSAR